jgi:hypothetical protein
MTYSMGIATDDVASIATAMATNVKEYQTMVGNMG